MSEYRDKFNEAQSEAYWIAPRVFIWLLLIMAVGFVLTFIGTGGDLAVYKFWAPKQENAKRQVFENTQSYVQGKIEYIGRMRFQYQQAEPGAGKEALRTLILNEASTVDNDKLPVDEQSFIRSLKGGL